MNTLFKIIFKGFKFDGDFKKDYKQKNEYEEETVFIKDKREKKKGSVLLISLIITLLAGFVYFYLALPIINPVSASFYVFLGIIVGIFAFISKTIEEFKYVEDKLSSKIRKYSIYLCIIAIIVYGALNVIASPVFFAKSYSKLINKKESVFAEDVKPISFSQIPVVDKTTAERLGSRKLGEIGGELVSQYDIDPSYSQINVKGRPYRVTPLTYSGIIKWFVNRGNGLGNYISVDMATQNTELVKLEKPIFYSFSDKFGRNIVRHIRFKRPTYIIGEINFELDDNGTPYWVASVLKPTIAFVGGFDVSKVLIVNANSGEIEEYDKDNVPEWVDRVYPSSMIEKQLEYNGAYINGFLNKYIKQTGVTKPTKGYNYLSIGNDIYFYTGITSVLSDKSNIGFVLVNMRTKDTKFYPVSSAEEFSVMESAEGTVQEKGYKSTFPILINLNDRPTYFLSLKDDAQLTKLFALIDAQKYQDVAIGSDIDEVVKNYNKLNSELITGSDSDEKIERTIKEIKAINIEGNTIFYFTAEEDNSIYVAPVNVSKDLIFAKEKDKIKITGYKSSDGTFNVTSVSK